MARTTTPQVVRSYCSQLKDALADLPAEVRDEIMAGVREELDGLDAVAAAARIEALGDPEFIAAEARAEAATVAPAGATAQVDTRDREPRWYPVLVALLVAFGGIIVPVIGWVVGLALMWMSKTWRLRDKWIASLTPFVAVAVLVLVSALTSLPSQPNVPSTSDFGNPLIPGFYSAVRFSVFLVIPVNAVVGIWLLWRAKHVWSSGERGSSSPAPGPEPVTTQQRQPSGWHSVVTVLLLIIGGYVIPVLGWVLGVVMLWASDAWTRREKWLGTLAGPLALLASGTLWLGALLWMRTSGAPVDPFLLIALSAIVLPMIANVLVGIRLLRRSKVTTT